jgi:pSer/pThr/pTyr-binding forkhead associated (FHA) protein
MLLYVMNGYEEGQFIELSENVVNLGRLYTVEKDGIINQIVLAHDREISRNHARFFQKTDIWFIEDINSRHGTFVDERKLSSPLEIKPGNVIRVGRTLLLVCQDRNNIPKMAVMSLSLSRN